MNLNAWVIAFEHSEGTTKGLKVHKSYFSTLSKNNLLRTLSLDSTTEHVPWQQ